LARRDAIGFSGGQGNPDRDPAGTAMARAHAGLWEA
jgi:hypothetical protein